MAVIDKFNGNVGDLERDKFALGGNNDVRVRTLTEFAGAGTTDAFGKLRISSPHTEFDAKQIFDNLPLLYDDVEETGSGTSSTWSGDLANTTLAVSLNTAGKRTRQTFRSFNYQPGKSQLIVMTGAFVSQTDNLTGITTGIGLYNDDNGIFFEVEEGVLKAVIRSSTSGSVVNTKYSQANWNGDTLDGSGDPDTNPSGILLDLTKDQLMFVQFEWLGIGKVYWGFYFDGVPKIVHTADHVNINLGPYMTTPNLPIRYQIENDGTGAATSMRCACQTVISEGAAGHQDTGIVRTISNGNTQVDANVGGTVYALVGVRLKSTHLGATVRPITVSVMALTNDNIEWLLLINPSVAGDPSYANVTNSALQSFNGATANTVTGGTAVAGGYISASKDGGAASAELESELVIGASIAGVSDTLVLAARPIGSGTLNADIIGSLTVRELA